AVIITIGLGQGLNGGCHFLRANHQHTELARELFGLADTQKVLLDAVNGLAQFYLSVLDPGSGGLSQGKRCHYVGGHLILEFEQFENGYLMPPATFIGPRPVAKSKVLQLPDKLQIEVATGAKVSHEAVWTAAIKTTG